VWFKKGVICTMIYIYIYHHHIIYQMICERYWQWDTFKWYFNKWFNLQILQLYENKRHVNDDDYYYYYYYYLYTFYEFCINMCWPLIFQQVLWCKTLLTDLLKVSVTSISTLVFKVIDPCCRYMKENGTYQSVL